MTTSPKRTARDKYKTYVRYLDDGVKLEAEVGPCVFMYPGYPLQITVTLHRHPGESLGVAYAVDRTKNATTYTDGAVKRLLASIRFVPCRCCSTPAFDPATIQTNRQGLCEACFLSTLEAEWAAAEKVEQLKLDARDRRMKQKSMSVRVSGWVHADEGDDYPVDWYFAASPTPEQIRSLLRKEGSAIMDDYQIIHL